jgi:hypothetical protein
VGGMKILHFYRTWKKENTSPRGKKKEREYIFSAKLSAVRKLKLPAMLHAIRKCSPLNVVQECCSYFLLPEDNIANYPPRADARDDDNSTAAGNKIFIPVYLPFPFFLCISFSPV